MIVKDAKPLFASEYRHVLVERIRPHLLYKMFDEQLNDYFPKGKAWYHGLEKAPGVGTELRLQVAEAKAFLEWQYKCLIESENGDIQGFDGDKLMDIREKFGKINKAYIQVEVVSVDTLKIVSSSNRKNTIVHPAGEIIVKPVNKAYDWEAYSFPANMLNLKKVRVSNH